MSRKKNSILTAKKLFADRHTTQSHVLSVITVSKNIFNITQQHETKYLSICRVIFLKLQQTCVSLLDLYISSFNYD
jgi:hypothetical protein